MRVMVGTKVTSTETMRFVLDLLPKQTTQNMKQANKATSGWVKQTKHCK